MHGAQLLELLRMLEWPEAFALTRAAVVRDIVDDQLRHIETIKRYFKQCQHGDEYEVETASTEPEIAAALRQGPPNLILLDPQLKQVDGIALLKQVRGLDASLPVIVVTGEQSARAAEEVLKAGVFTYVPKPCGCEHLEHLVGLVFSQLFKAARVAT